MGGREGACRRNPSAALMRGERGACAMNRVQGFWAAESFDGGTDGTAAHQGAEVVEATLSWRDARGDNVLARKEASAGAKIVIGEDAELLVPAEVLGYESFEVATFDGERALAMVPPGGKLRVDGWAREERQVEVVRGHSVEVLVGAFVVKLARVHSGTKLAAPPLAGLKRAGVGIVVASALAHAAVFAVLAYSSAALGATEGDAYDTDRIMLMQKLIDASSQREQEQLTADGETANTGGAAESKPAEGLEGQAGKDTPKTDGKWAAKGTATPETATMARDRILAEAAQTGMLGILSSVPAMDPNAPVVPWGTQLNGANDVNAVGHLFGSSIDDAFGTGGWGLTGPGEGGGGTAQMIGLGNGFGPLGGTGSCTGGGPCNGIGHGTGALPGQHKPGFHGGIREPGPVQTNGHLAPEIIQRIVRQNQGRFRFCYEQGLRGNPALTGRVTVKFMISRDGSVGIATDAGSDIPDASVTSCVVRSFTAMSFPAPDNGIVSVVYPLMFTPE
jgi:hypothetical protein